jgi:hypothetical protein
MRNNDDPIVVMDSDEFIGPLESHCILASHIHLPVTGAFLYIEFYSLNGNPEKTGLLGNNFKSMQIGAIGKIDSGNELAHDASSSEHMPYVRLMIGKGGELRSRTKYESC